MKEHKERAFQYGKLQTLAIWIAALLTALADYCLGTLLRGMTDQLERFHKDTVAMTDARPDDGLWVLGVIGVTCLGLAAFATMVRRPSPAQVWSLVYSQISLFVSGYIFWTYSQVWFKVSMFL